MQLQILLPLLALAAGILSAGFGADYWFGAAELLLGAAIYLLLIFKSRDPLESFRMQKFHCVWIGLLFLGLGTVTADFSRPFRMPSDNFSGIKAAEGRIVSVSHKSWGDRCEVEVLKLFGNDGNVYDCTNFRAILQSDVLTKDIDDVVTFPGSFSRISDSPNSLSGGYALQMERKGILYSVWAEDRDIHPVGHSTTLSGLATECRYDIEEFIEKTPIAKQTQHFLITVLLGDRAYLDENVRSLFADAGVSHILALSGMHIMIIAAIFMALLFPLNFRGWYKQRILIATLMVFGYAFVTGAAPSTVRACVMAACVAAGILLERKNSAMNALLLAVFIILLFTPSAIYDVGLQLSFVCVASLILFMQPLNPVDEHRHNTLYKIMAALLSTLIATAGSWAITAYYFHTFPLLFIPANLLVLPLLPFYISAAILYLALYGVGINATFLENALDGSLSLLYRMLEWITDGGASALTFVISHWTVWLWLGGVVMIAIALHSSRRKMLFHLSGALLVIGAIVLIPFSSEANRREMLICSDYYDIRMLVSDGGLESELKFIPGAVSRQNVLGKTLIALDCDASGFNPDSLIKCDYLIISKGFKGKLSDITDKFNPQTIVIHRSVFPKREKRLLAEADSLQIDSHSLRHSPLRIKL